MNPPDRLSKRLTEVELQLMHLQNDYDSLNEVVLRHEQRLDEALARVNQLTQKIESDGEQSDHRDPIDEIPPHY